MDDKSAHIRVIREIRVLSFVDGSVVLCWRLPGFPIGAPDEWNFLVKLALLILEAFHIYSNGLYISRYWMSLKSSSFLVTRVRFFDEAVAAITASGNFILYSLLISIALSAIFLVK